MHVLGQMQSNQNGTATTKLPPLKSISFTAGVSQRPQSYLSEKYQYKIPKEGFFFLFFK